MKKRVVLRAPVLSMSGYGVHSRQFAKWLLERDDIDLTIIPVQWGITPWLISHEQKNGLVGKIMEKCNGSQGPFDISFQVQLPNEWDNKLAKVNIGVTAGVETNICNEQWIKNIQSMDKVVVPSTFVKSVFENTAKKKIDNIVVIHEPFPDEILANQKNIFEFSTKFNFLTVGQLTGNGELDRKNLFNLIKWFCEEFCNDQDVGLVIKTNSGRESKIDRMVTFDIIVQQIAQHRKTLYPKIHVVHGYLDDTEMGALYNCESVKAFVSLTHGEGFGLPLLEAAAVGLPIITTNWSGHLDFLSLGKFIKLDFELKQLPNAKIDNSIFMNGSQWADVNELDVKKKLRRFFEKPSTPKEWASELKKDVIQKFSFSASVKRLNDLIV